MTISSSNNYTGQTVVNNGVLKFGSTGAATSLGGGIVATTDSVAETAGTVDANGVNFSTAEVHIKGAGYLGQGAFVSSVGNQSTLQKLVLDGDASIGTIGTRVGTCMATPHTSLPDPLAEYIHGNGYALTKVGSGEIWLKQLGDIGVGDINSHWRNPQASRTTSDSVLPPERSPCTLVQL